MVCVVYLGHAVVDRVAHSVYLKAQFWVRHGAQTRKHLAYPYCSIRLDGKHQVSYVRAAVGAPVNSTAGWVLTPFSAMPVKSLDTAGSVCIKSL